MSHLPTSQTLGIGIGTEDRSPPPTPETLRGLRPFEGPAPLRVEATRPASLPPERLLVTRGWHRLVEQRGGLLMHAGTVELVGFACAARPPKVSEGGEGTREPPPPTCWFHPACLGLASSICRGAPAKGS